MLRWLQFRLKSRERSERALGLLDDRLARAESLLEQSTGDVSRCLVAVDKLVSHLGSVEERSGRSDALLQESLERLSHQVETVRLFASRVEPVDERSARTEAHLRDATESLSKQIEAIRLFASRIEPIDERSARTERHVLDAAKTLSTQIEAVRLFASRIEPVDERSARAEAHLIDATQTLSKQIETVRLLVSRIEPVDERSARAEAYLIDATRTLSKQIETVRLLASQIGPVDERLSQMNLHFRELTGLLALLEDRISESRAGEIASLSLHKARLLKLFGPITLSTDVPVALESPDHMVPWGTANDNSRQAAFSAKLIRLLGSDRVSVLDLGCSGGGQVRDFIERGYLAIGVEGSDYSLRRLRAEWLNIPEFLFTADITKPFKVRRVRDGEPARFGAVTLWEVIEHIRAVDLQAVLLNIDAHLLPGGLVIMSVSPNPEVIEGTVLHQTVQPADWWLATFHTLGWRNHPELVSYFAGAFVRGGADAPNSFHLVLSRANEDPAIAS